MMDDSSSDDGDERQNLPSFDEDKSTEDYILQKHDG